MTLKIWVHFAAYTLVLIVMITGFTRVEFSDDFVDTLVAKGDGAYDRYIEYLENFPSDVAVIVAAENLACSEAGWDLIQRLHTNLELNEHVDSVHSIAGKSAKYVVFDSLEVRTDRFTDYYFDNPRNRCEAAASYEPFARRLVASQIQAVALLVTANKDSNPADFAKSIVDTKNSFSDEATTLDGALYVTGDPVMNIAISDAIARDMVFVVGMTTAMLILVGLVTRSLRTSAAAFLTIVFSTCTAFGMMGWLGIYLTPGTALAVFLLIPLSTAFVIHAHGYASRPSSAGSLLSRATKPTVVAGITTSFLFGLTGWTSIPDIQALAIVGVFGVLSATLCMFLLTFPLLEKTRKPQFLWAFRVPTWAIVNPRISVLILIFLTIQCAIGLNNLKFEYEAIDYLPMSNSERAEFEIIGAWFGRMNIPLVLDAGNLSDPDVWKRAKHLVDEVDAQYLGNVQIHWFYDQIKLLSVALTDSQVQFPRSDQEFDQLFLWFEPDDYEGFVNVESSQISITFSVPFISSTDYFHFKRVIETELEEQELNGQLVGRVSSFFETGHQVGLDNIASLGVGAAVVFVGLIFLFRSVSMAAIALIVNLIPALSALSLLGLTNVPIDLGSSVVTAIAFGIIIDDSTHLLWRVQELQRSGYDPNTAVFRATRELASPIVLTTLTVCVGFSFLFFAELRPFQDFALTIIVALFVAVIADIAILPSLVKTFIKDRVVL